MANGRFMDFRRALLGCSLPAHIDLPSTLYSKCLQQRDRESIANNATVSNSSVNIDTQYLNSYRPVDSLSPSPSVSCSQSFASHTIQAAANETTTQSNFFILGVGLLRPAATTCVSSAPVLLAACCSSQCTFFFHSFILSCNDLTTVLDTPLSRHSGSIASYSSFDGCNTK